MSGDDVSYWLLMYLVDLSPTPVHPSVHPTPVGRSVFMSFVESSPVVAPVVFSWMKSDASIVYQSAKCSKVETFVLV